MWWLQTLIFLFPSFSRCCRCPPITPPWAVLLLEHWNSSKPIIHSQCYSIKLGLCFNNQKTVTFMWYILIFQIIIQMHLISIIQHINVMHPKFHYMYCGVHSRWWYWWLFILCGHWYYNGNLWKWYIVHDYYYETWMSTSHGPTVHQLLSSQSALMFLTMGGCTGATSYYAGSSLSSSTLVRSPGDSLVDVPGGSGAMVRKRSQLIPRDSGSSLGSESSVTPSCAMHHSHTFSTGEQTMKRDHC